MRVIYLILAVALLGAAPCPQPSSSPATEDRFPELLGSWTCHDGANVVSTLAFSRDRDAIVATDRRTIADMTFGETQRYRFDASKGLWQIEGRRPSVSFSGSAPPWTGTEWDVVGTTTFSYAIGGSTQDPRTIRYVRVGDGPLYRGAPGDGPGRVNGVVCALGNVPPDPALCPASRVAAMTLRVAEPGMAYGERGRVEIAVTLDADSHVVGTRVASSTNSSLNRIFEQAARRSTFRTEYRDCHPVPSEYLFTVEAG
jgi:hypothetical protein